MKRKMLAEDRGFTLVETLITVLIAAAVMFSVFRVFTATNHSYRRGSESIDGQQNSRAALTWLSRELRSAKSFAVIDPDEVTFTSDVNVTNQLRTFRLDTTDFDNDGDVTELLLIRNPADDGSAGPVTDEVAVGIQTLAFTYRDGSGAATTFRAAVQEVEVSIQAQGSAGMRDEDRDEGHQVRMVEMSTRVRCRNLGKSVPTLGDVTPPDAPIGLAATFGCGTATVTWSANAEADVSGYYLHYNVGGGPPYDGTEAVQGPSPIFVGNATNYTLTGLDLNSTYAFNVQAVDGADNVSGYASEVNGDPEDSLPPAIPTNFAGRVVGNDQIQLSWSRPSEWDVAMFKVRYYPDGLPGSTSVDSTSQTSMVIEGLADDVTYHFTVTALDACGNESDKSSPISLVMQPCSEDTDAPDVPSSFSAVSGDEFVLLAWTPVSDYDVVGYQVYVEESGESGGSTLLVGNVDHYYVYGLQNGIEYSFQVAALDGCGHAGGYTTMQSATPIQCADNAAPPAAPSNLVANDLGVGDMVRVSWTAGSEGDLLGYTVHWGTDPSAFTNSVDAGNAVYYEIGGLTAGVTYYFSVVSRDVCGNESAFSAAVSEVPTGGCACPPSVTIVEPNDLQVLAGLTEFAATVSACSTATIEYVAFEIDGTTRFVDYTAPYQFNDAPYGWDTELETRGPHALRAVVKDDNDCEAADSANVFVDNTLVGTACLGIEDGDEAVISGTFGETLSIPFTNLSTVHAFELQRMSIAWQSGGLTILAIALDGYSLYSAMGFPGLASGDTIDATYPTMIPPDEEMTLTVTFWSDPYTTMPTFDFEAADLSLSTFGNPGLQCGPYPVRIDVECNVGVTISSVNSTSPYDTVVDPVVGTQYYSDRTYTITSLPTEVEDSVLLRTPNADKNKGDAHLMIVAVDEPVTVYIAYDPRGTPPNWIKNTYVNTGLSLGVTDTGTPTLGIWRANFAAGNITFSGNRAAGFTGSVGTNYVVFFTCQ